MAGVGFQSLVIWDFVLVREQNSRRTEGKNVMYVVNAQAPRKELLTFVPHRSVNRWKMEWRPAWSQIHHFHSSAHLQNASTNDCCVTLKHTQFLPLAHYPHALQQQYNTKPARAAKLASFPVRERMHVRCDSQVHHDYRYSKYRF